MVNFGEKAGFKTNLFENGTLMERLEEEWYNIDQELGIKLIESMFERMQRYLKEKK